MIPKVIHWCDIGVWSGSDSEERFRDFVASCHGVSGFEDFAFVHWDMERVRGLSNRWVLDCLCRLPGSLAYLRDWLKVYALYTNGGFFIDASVVPELSVVRSFKPLLGERLFFGLESHAVDFRGYGFGFMGAERGNAVLGRVLDWFTIARLVDEDGHYAYTESCEPFFAGMGGKLEYMYDSVRRSGSVMVDGNATVFPRDYFHADSRLVSDNTYCAVREVSPAVSVLMPVYNAEAYVGSAMYSILTQQTDFTFEVVVVDDGSTDASVGIIKSFQDRRVRICYMEHGGIVSALNEGLSVCRGDYIMRMDADDIMLPGRIQHQVAYMRMHPCEVLSSGRLFLRDMRKQGNSGDVTLSMLLKGNVVSHPSVMFDGRWVREKRIRYPSDFPYSEDYALWVDVVHRGFRVHMEPTPVVLYRDSYVYRSDMNRQQTESTSRVKDILMSLLDEERGSSKGVESRGGLLLRRRQDEEVVSEDTSQSSSKVTAILTFMNEGEEVERTVRSIKMTSMCPIILVDDCSTDGFDYAGVARRLGCDYVRNEKNLGVGPSRDIGVMRCRTPYFILLDAHMRFYDKDWDEWLAHFLDREPDMVLCANTSAMHLLEDGTIENEDGKVRKVGQYGAYINMADPGWELTAKWTHRVQDLHSEVVAGRELQWCEVACVLGATYCSSVEWWKKIRGLYGLRHYGSDEPLMSLKTWLFGGRCLLIYNWWVGHLYRTPKDKPYRGYSLLECYNRILLAKVFLQDESRLEATLSNMEKHYGSEMFTKAKGMIDKESEAVVEYASFVRDNSVIGLDGFLSGVNSRFEPEKYGERRVPRTVVLFKTHKWNDVDAYRFKKLCSDLKDLPGYSVTALYDGRSEDVPQDIWDECSVVCFSHESLLTLCRYGEYYPVSSAAYEDSGLAASMSLLPMLWFGKDFKADRYWQVESDVMFTGNWRDFFSAFDGNPARFLAYDVSSGKEVSWVKTVRRDGVFSQEDVDWYWSLNCVCRVEGLFLSALLDSYRKGMYGHYEVCVATRCVQKYGKHSVGDIRDSGMVGAYGAFCVKDSEDMNDTSAFEANKLYHSCKGITSWEARERCRLGDGSVGESGI